MYQAVTSSYGTHRHTRTHSTDCKLAIPLLEDLNFAVICGIDEYFVHNDENL